jgi:hypothetical protein
LRDLIATEDAKKPPYRVIIGALIIVAIVIIIAFILLKHPISSVTTTIPSNLTQNRTTGQGSGTSQNTSNSTNVTTSIAVNSTTGKTTTISGSKTTATTTINTSTAPTTAFTTTIAGGSSNSTTNSTNSTIPSYIYCVGTQGAFPYNLSYYAQINSSGIGNWNATFNYTQPLFDAGCAIGGNYIYCVGSGLYKSSSTDSFFAPIAASGIGVWEQTTNYPLQLTGGGCSISNNYIYCVGGNTTHPQAAYYASVSSSGIGNWMRTANYPIGLYDSGCLIYNNYIYCFGTEYGNRTTPEANLQKVYYGKVSSSGIKNWTETVNYPVPFYGAGCSAYNNTIYCIGNSYTNFNPINNNTAQGDYSNLTYYSQISPSGTLEAWSQTTQYPGPLSNAGCVVSNGYIYCVGSSNVNYTQSAYYAPLSSYGIGQWNETTNYPIPLSNAYCSTTGESGGLYSG